MGKPYYSPWYMRISLTKLKHCTRNWFVLVRQMIYVFTCHKTKQVFKQTMVSKTSTKANLIWHAFTSEVKSHNFKGVWLGPQFNFYEHQQQDTIKNTKREQFHSNISNIIHLDDVSQLFGPSRGRLYIILIGYFTAWISFLDKGYNILYPCEHLQNDENLKIIIMYKTCVLTNTKETKKIH